MVCYSQPTKKKDWFFFFHLFLALGYFDYTLPQTIHTFLRDFGWFFWLQKYIHLRYLNWKESVMKCSKETDFESSLKNQRKRKCHEVFKGDRFRIFFKKTNEKEPKTMAAENWKLCSSSSSSDWMDGDNNESLEQTPRPTKTNSQQTRDLFELLRDDKMC
jgi:hypothetical protein